MKRLAVSLSAWHALTQTVEVDAQPLASPTIATAPDESAARAQALFDEGVRSAEAARWAEALTRFQGSCGIHEGAPCARWITVCFFQLRDAVNAWRSLRRYDSLRDRGLPPNLQIEQIRAPIERGVGRLRVTRSAVLLLHAAVSLDGAPLTHDELRAPVPVTPGQHVLCVTLLGEAPFERGVEVDGGAEIEVSLEPPPVAQIQPPRAQRTVGYVLVGLGAALAAGTATTWVLSALQRDDSAHDPQWLAFFQHARVRDVDSACRVASESAAPDADHARDLCATSALYTGLTVGFGVGAAALVGVGAALVATSPRATRGATRVAFAPLFVARATGAMLAVSF